MCVVYFCFTKLMNVHEINVLEVDDFTSNVQSSSFLIGFTTKNGILV